MLCGKLLIQRYKKVHFVSFFQNLKILNPMQTRTLKPNKNIDMHA